MAAVLDAFVPYVKKLIADVAQDEVSMLLGVSGEITKLEDNMEGLRAFVADAERRRLTDQTVQRWVRKLKDAMYDATDILDLCQLEADKRKESGGDRNKQNNAPPGCLQPLLFCLRNPVFAHKIGSRIKELNQRLEGIHKAARDFSFNINLASYPEQRMLTTAEFSSYQARSQIDESAIVGEQIERDTKELVQVLTATTPDDGNDIHHIKVVSIVGTGGMGKTTLAQKIFNETTIEEHFKTKIWLSISKNFDDVELLRTAIKHAGGDHGGEHQDKSTLTDTLMRTLASSGAGSSRFLLVMDDVWSERAWNDVLGVPVRNASRMQQGSRVLVTTRYAHLTQQMQAPLHEHRVHPLHEDDAWSLLKKQLQPDQVVGIEHLKNIGMEILKKCDGLPLAVKVMGGLLSTRYPSEHEWKTVLNKPAWSLAGLPAELDSRIYLSYEDLSPQLRQCFLYFSLFPKVEMIHQGTIINMWVSEGFIQCPADSSHEYGLEEMASEYYTELIKRNLIEPIKNNSLTGYTCTMHDVVHSFAEYMAGEESLVVLDKQQLVATAGGHGGGILVRRLSVGQQTVSIEWAVLQSQESPRTLIINSKQLQFKSGDSLGSFSSMRVLYIKSADSDGLIPSLTRLKQLRYLLLQDTDISRLPDDIHKMKFLQYIQLHNCKKLSPLPRSIVKLVHLRALAISGSSNVSVLPKGLGGLTNLRSLWGFPVHVDMDVGNGWCSLQELAPLSQLRGLALYGLEKVPATWMAEKAMISTKGHLSILELNYNSTVEHTAGPRAEAEQPQQQSVTKEVLEKLRPPTCLESLIIKGYVGHQLPNWISAPASSTDFKSLRYLSLENLPSCTQLPDGLCCLPSLERLIIEDAPSIKHVGPEFQAPSSLAAGGASTAAFAPFPKLKELQLDGLPKWEEWEWNDSEEKGDPKATISMPCLEELYIQNCKLSRLPPGLASIKRLALRALYMYKLTNMTALESLPSVVQLDVFDFPELKRISGLSKLQKIRILRCPNLLVLEGVPALDSMVLEDRRMEALPKYLAVVNPRYLELKCGKNLYEALSSGTSEWKKIGHIRKLNIICIEE
ncbi:hypothetical protein BS78_05G213800 [Paspalum vaginatum]|nr:hypothetical protein BS78_05G213800 [Paspalum vaginatum]KAJ1276430.1 hypothetical protein BS78_05G213800 [Paspalum vaginatum]KAJ1276431.1 hypothetical protein BS78_05G213800 [Paspalum vaginatum]KAJ1276432.1 hypothetical protein BS78_05G213800 [Paspalum vaginatum]